MAFGLNISKVSNVPDIIKYDANAGRLFRIDYDGEKTSVDITTPPPRFAIDFGTLQVGYICFTPNGPDMRMVPEGHPVPQQPDDVDDKGRKLYRAGFHALCYGRVLGGLREFSSSATCVLESMEDLYKKFQDAPEAMDGRIPVVELTRTIPVTFGKKNPKTSYAPMFNIVGWTGRVPDMGERTVPPPKPRPPETVKMAVAVPPAVAPPRASSSDLDDEIPF
jgi:hypothetical protein